VNILWFTWKDKKHPQAGGAELLNEEIIKRIVKEGHSVTMVVGNFKGGEQEEVVDGYKIVRIGNRYSLYTKSASYFKKNLSDWSDITIEEVNTMPFFTQYYTKGPRILFINQLCREIWFYQLFFPLSIIGYIVEPVYLYLLRKNKVVTISESTKKDLLRFGFSKKNIDLIPMGTEIPPLEELSRTKKFTNPTILSLGTIRPMKNTVEQLEAYEIARGKIHNLKLIVVGQGEGKYFDKFTAKINKSKYKNDITFLGKVSFEKKMELMRKCHIITVTSVKEGWGLIVTEANSQGTPAIVYNVDGLRDSVRDNVTGLITKKENTPEELAKKILSLLKDKKKYRKIRKNAWEWSKGLTFDASYNSFKQILSKNKMY
jgi:glycosyltransferase involved in cell wall biosynthesis